MVITYYDIVIIGGGIIGENIAYSLQSETNHIALIDDTDGYKATHAAGGMLGAQNEFTEDSALYQLSMLGQQMMPEHIQKLEQITGLSIDLKQHGLLKIASPGDLERLIKQYEFLRSNFKTIDWIDDHHMSQFANGMISSSFQQAMWIPTDGQVNALKYLTALKHANAAIDRINEKVINISKSNHLYCLSTSGETINCEKLIIAAGCKSDHLLNMVGYECPMQGVKGEVLTLHHPDVHFNETLFQTNGHYIVPKANHHYLIGATTSLNTQKSPGAAGVKWLLDETFKLVPALESSTIVKIDCGFRPEIKQHHPIIGQIDNNLFVATGHYRNGILLSRITAELIRQTICQHGELYQQFKFSFRLGEQYENIYQ
ncbi:NAD(P)/FAD-dependent oxidoreductase [Macrococcus equi]|uniref:NAD(P)/FAD-dependent oxidoreductase n=1 Tax=Macrococcus equi TaxID=3395462 RepID=UPI0039BEA488